MTKSQRINRYLKIMDWLRNRYVELDAHGVPFLTVNVGGKATAYTRLETAFFQRYVA